MELVFHNLIRFSVWENKSILQVNGGDDDYSLAPES